MQLTFDKGHQMMRLSTGYVTFKRMLNMELNFEFICITGSMKMFYM